jgi:hypothetical protein
MSAATQKMGRSLVGELHPLGDQAVEHAAQIPVDQPPELEGHVATVLQQAGRVVRRANAASKPGSSSASTTWGRVGAGISARVALAVASPRAASMAARSRGLRSRPRQATDLCTARGPDSARVRKRARSEPVDSAPLDRRSGTVPESWDES